MGLSRRDSAALPVPRTFPGGTRALRARTLPAGLTLKLNVEGHDIVFKPPNKTDPKKPDVMIFSNGDLSAFELTVVRDGATRSVKLAVDDKGHIATTASPEKPT